MMNLLRAFAADVASACRDFGREVASAGRDLAHDIAAPFKDAAWLRAERQRLEHGDD